MSLHTLDLETISCELETVAILGGIALDTIPNERSLKNVPAALLIGTFNKLNALISVMIDKNRELSGACQKLAESLLEAEIRQEKGGKAPA